MQIVVFTKIFQELDVQQTGDTVRDLGFDGFDLAVRPGHCVSPQNAPEVPAERRKAVGRDGSCHTADFTGG